MRSELKDEPEEVGVDPLHFFQDKLDVSEQRRFKVFALNEILANSPITVQYQGQRSYLVNVLNIFFRPIDIPYEKVK